MSVSEEKTYSHHTPTHHTPPTQSNDTHVSHTTHTFLHAVVALSLFSYIHCSLRCEQTATQPATTNGTARRILKACVGVRADGGRGFDPTSS